MTWSYKCGHTSNCIITDNNVLTLSAYFVWSESVGLEGDMSECWKCFCKKRSEKRVEKK